MFKTVYESKTESIFMLIYITYKSQSESSGKCGAGEKLEGHSRRIHRMIRKKDAFIVIIGNCLTKNRYRGQGDGDMYVIMAVQLEMSFLNRSAETHLTPEHLQ